MYRYTTPTIGITFPSSVDPDDIVDFYATITQGSETKIEKKKSEFTRDSENEQRFYTVLTEEETALLCETIPAKIQVRANIDGTSVASQITVFDVAEVLKEGAILP